MFPSEKMSQVIYGKRYSVSTATQVASDEYWDGHNMERHGRNTFLYRTPKGAYFSVHLTMYQGESDSITPLSEQEALDLWESLPTKAIEWEEAFPNQTLEDA